MAHVVEFGYPSGLTAAEIMMAIHYFYDPAASGLYSLSPGAAQLRRKGLLDEDKLTPCGIAFVRHILETPLPTQSWAVVRNPAAEHGFPA